MAADGAVVVVGGTRAIGLEIVRHYAAAGREVVLTGRDPESVVTAADVVRRTRAGRHLRPRRADDDRRRPWPASGPVQRLVLVAIDRDQNTVADYDLARAIRLVTLKLVGYTEVVHTLRDRLTDDASHPAVRRHGQGAARTRDRRRSRPSTAASSG